MTSTTPRTLIFPAGMPRSLSFLAQAQAEGRQVIGSSSLGFDPARAHYPMWAHLPYITAPEFTESLQQLIVAQNITEIYTPNPIVWNYLQQQQAIAFPTIRLLNGSPVDSELAPYRAALEFAQQLMQQPLKLATRTHAHQPASTLELAALFRHAETIPGMCDHEKIRALCEISRFCPAGDIVEIGSWWGKSAFVLTRLAALYDIGKVLCVDPWSNEHLLQHDKQGLVDHIPIDAAEALTVFQLNLLPYAQHRVNYLRLPSVDAADNYRNSKTVTTAEFGSTDYSGRIALLHIDGNHSHDSVQADVNAWADWVMPAGWIVIDDYRWPYDDGPRRVADQFLLAHRQRIELAFYQGGAMFVRLIGTPI